MDQPFESLSIPWWIWVALASFLLFAVVVFVLKYEKPDNERYRPYRDSHSARRHRHHRHRRH